MAGTSRLEAVNVVLRALQEEPVTALSSDRTSRAGQAEAALDLSARRVFMQGHPFNTNFVRLRADASKQITVAGDVLTLKVLGTEDGRYVLRGKRLFDRGARSGHWGNTQNRGFDFEPADDFRVLLTKWLPWEMVPEHAKQLIIAAAARDLSKEKTGDAKAARVLEEKWARALQRFETIEADSGVNTLLSDEWQQQRQPDPRTALFGRYFG